MRLKYLWPVLLALTTLVAVAQDAPMLDARTVTDLQPAVQIDYANAPEEAGRLESGGFAMSADASRLAVRNRDDSIVVWNAAGELLDVFAIPGADGLPDTVLDLALNADGSLLAAIASDGAEYTIAVRDLAGQETVARPFLNAPDIPLRVWFGAELPYLWLEVRPVEAGEPAYVARMPFGMPGQVVDARDVLVLPSGPENDPDAFARIGRIPAPYAITATQDGFVKLWDLTTGETVASAGVDGFPVFGGINPGATHFAWRDPESTALHLLDFTTGEDKIVAPLDSDYISYIMLSPAADVIVGVHVGGEPVVVAWDTATGERIELGEYRECARTPDMARLSRDGSTLVIGCDTGLDIWRLEETDA